MDRNAGVTDKVQISVCFNIKLFELYDIHNFRLLSNILSTVTRL